MINQVPVDLAELFRRSGIDGRVSMLFRLEQEPGAMVPQSIAGLGAEIELDLCLAAQYFASATGNLAPWGTVMQFMQCTDRSAVLHRFTGSSIAGRDEEASSGLSGQFAKCIGIGFMAQYGDAIWFYPLPKKGTARIETTHGKVVVRRSVTGRRWPDYLAAASQVGQLPNPCFALEFKGQAAYVDFSRKSFIGWVEQSKNISVVGADGRPLGIESWVLAFNYRCAGKTATHEASTLLAHDPWVGPRDAEPFAEGGSIVRAHLARQMRMLGLRRLAQLVLTGGRPRQDISYPQTYTIRHAGCRDRRYVGRFFALGPDGILRPASLAVGASLLPSTDVRVEVRGRPGRFWTCCMRGTDRARMIHVHADIYDSGGLLTKGQVREWCRSLLSGRSDLVFVGQDAGMVRGCLSISDELDLAGDAFNEAPEFHSVDDRADGGFVQVIRNGSLIASSQLVEIDREPIW